MILKNILSQVEGATRPVSKIIRHQAAFKTIAVGLKKGMLWNDHKAALPTKLLLIQGRAVYRQGEQIVALEQFDDLDIPVNVIHSLEALENCLCILIQAL